MSPVKAYDRTGGVRVTSSTMTADLHAMLHGKDMTAHTRRL